MRRSLLLINPLLITAILAIGQCPKSKSNEDKEADAKRDSVSNIMSTPMVDSLGHNYDSTGVRHVTKDSTEMNRIEHGSDQQAKLDSIKKAKTKKKH